MPKEILDKKVAIDLDSDGKSDIKLDLKFIALLVGGVISLTMTYSQLTAEIEVAKTLPEYEINQDDTRVINQKMDYIIRELERFEKQTEKRLENLEEKVYKR